MVRQQTLDVCQSSATLAVPEHQTAVRMLCHLTIFRCVKLETLHSARRRYSTRGPVTDVVARRRPDEKDLNIRVAPLSELLLHRAIGAIGISNDDWQLPLYQLF